MRKSELTSQQQAANKISQIAKILILIAYPIVLLFVIFGADIQTADLITQVYKVDAILPQTDYLYLIINALVLIFPLLLSFDKKVHFYTWWPKLAIAISIVGGIFIAWDVAFTHAGIWGFNSPYIKEDWSIFGLPPGEWLFFFTVPYACTFIYACLNAYIKRDIFAPAERTIIYSIVGILTLSVIPRWELIYTSVTFLSTAWFLLFHYWILKTSYLTRAIFAYTVGLIPFIITDGALTGLFTAEPIVIYNPLEFTNIRIGSIPIEDAVYGFLLVVGVITVYEQLKPKQHNIE